MAICRKGCSLQKLTGDGKQGTPFVLHKCCTSRSFTALRRSGSRSALDIYLVSLSFQIQFTLAVSRVTDSYTRSQLIKRVPTFVHNTYLACTHGKEMRQFGASRPPITYYQHFLPSFLFTYVFTALFPFLPSHCVRMHQANQAAIIDRHGVPLSN